MTEIEYLDIVDLNDNIIGKKLRTDILPSDIYRVSSLWVFDKDKNFLIAKRPEWKSHDANKWTESAVGTVAHGETYLVNIIKEAKEELGLDIKEEHLILVKKMFHNDDKFKMFGALYVCILDRKTIKLNINLHEVPEVEWISHTNITKEFANKNNRFVVGLEKYYDVVWGFVKDY